jgi:hypothetical protein
MDAGRHAALRELHIWKIAASKGNYPRLQQVKASWHPRNGFHHALAIEPLA